MQGSGYVKIIDCEEALKMWMHFKNSKKILKQVYCPTWKMLSNKLNPGLLESNKMEN